MRTVKVLIPLLVCGLLVVLGAAVSGVAAQEPTSTPTVTGTPTPTYMPGSDRWVFIYNDSSGSTCAGTDLYDDSVENIREPGYLYSFYMYRVDADPLWYRCFQIVPPSDVVSYTFGVHYIGTTVGYKGSADLTRMKSTTGIDEWWGVEDVMDVGVSCGINNTCSKTCAQGYTMNTQTNYYPIHTDERWAQWQWHDGQSFYQAGMNDWGVITSQSISVTIYLSDVVYSQVGEPTATPFPGFTLTPFPSITPFDTPEGYGTVTPEPGEIDIQPIGTPVCYQVLPEWSFGPEEVLGTVIEFEIPGLEFCFQEYEFVLEFMSWDFAPIVTAFVLILGFAILYFIIKVGG